MIQRPFSSHFPVKKPETSEQVTDNSVAGLEKTVLSYFTKTFHIKSDELVGYCSCVLKRADESRTGGLYISINHISFYSPGIFTYETSFQYSS